MLIVVIALLVGGGLVAGGILVLGGDDESAQAADPPTADPPTAGPTTDPAPTTDPTTPSPTPTASPGTPTGEQAKLEAALERRGFRCGLSILRPVAVRTCYHDPYLPYGDAYVQSVLDADGAPRWVDVQVVRRHFAGRRYRCEVDAGFRSVDCLRKAGRETYAASGLAPCVGRQWGRVVPCPGRAPSMTVFWGLDHRRITNAMVRRVIDGVFLPGARLAMGGKTPPALRSWLLQNLDGDLHVADFDGLHLSIDPNTRFTDREAEVALSVTYVSPPS